MRYPPLMKMYRNQAMQNKSLVMDGAQFVDCSLSNCKLNYNGGIVVLRGTTLTSCKWEFGGAALNTVELLTTLGAVRNPIFQGMISIPEFLREA